MFTDSEKRLLGLLFKRYRNEFHVPISEIERADISSVNTLYVAMKGEIIKNNKFYLEYCKFYNREFIRKENFDEWIKGYIPKIIHAFDYLQEDSFERLYQEYIRELEPYKNSAIYHEYYIVLEVLFSYYLRTEYVRLEEVYKILDLIRIKIFDKELSLYILDFLFRCNYNYIFNQELPELIIHEMEKIDTCHYIYKYQKAFMHRISGNYMSALNLFNDCHTQAKKENNYNREVQALIAIYGIYQCIDESMEEKTSKELMVLKNNPILPKRLKHNINYNIGMKDYADGNYERAYQLFNQNIHEYQYLHSLLYLCSICSRTNKEYPEVLNTEIVKERYDFECLNYFIMKQEGHEYLKLAQYIIDVICPSFLACKSIQQLDWELFEYELFEMAQKDIKIRKYYIEYMDIMKKRIRKV